MAKHPVKMDGNSFGPQILINIDKSISNSTVLQMELAKMNKATRNIIEGLRYG
ncbi:MAG: hypothetical protein ABSA64_08600 [Sedimentisphaerales bacterium]|jgi:hypothetical protein